MNFTSRGHARESNEEFAPPHSGSIVRYTVSMRSAVTKEYGLFKL